MMNDVMIYSYYLRHLTLDDHAYIEHGMGPNGRGMTFITGLGVLNNDSYELNEVHRVENTEEAREHENRRPSQPGDIA